MIAETLAIVAGVFQPAPCTLEGVPADYEQQQGVQCGWVSVPLRVDEPNGVYIRLWTARIRGTGKRRGDPVLYINGGPGIATVDAILPNLTESKTMGLLRQDRDVILFDQRGSGRSEQTLCPTLAKNLNAIEAAGLNVVEEESKNQAEFRNCRAEMERAGQDISAYTTAATVADMEVLRSAFEVTRWNLVSISYGSLVALHAMRTTPGPIRSVILNSPYPPNSVTWAEQVSSAAAAYVAIDRECATQPVCKKQFGAIIPKLESTLARLEKSPLKDGGGLINGRRFASALWPMAVRSSSVRFVPLAISRAQSGDNAMIKKMVAKFASGDSFGDYSPAQGYAISCHESGRTSAWYRRARALYPALVSDASDDSWDQMCASYRPGFADPSFFAPVASDIPTLIYAGSLDPATPVVDAYQTMRFLTRATLVEVHGTAHGPMAVDDCTSGIATAFLANPTTLPETSCVVKRTPIDFATKGLDELLTP